MLSGQNGPVSKTDFDTVSGHKLTPFGQGLGTVFLEFFAAVELAFEIEVVVNRGLDGGELLKTSHRPEPVHYFLSSPQRLMRVFSFVIQPPRGRLAIRNSRITKRGLVGR